MLATVGVGCVNVLMTFVAMGLIDRIGRRKLMFIGFAGAALSLGMIAVAAGTGASDLQALALVGLLLYIAAFAVAIGPLPWVMMSEIFPLHLRGPGMSAASITNWVFNFIVVLTFPCWWRPSALRVCSASMRWSASPGSCSPPASCRRPARCRWRRSRRI